MGNNQEDGVNISSGDVKFGGDLRGRDKHVGTSSDAPQEAGGKPSQERDCAPFTTENKPISFELAIRTDWSEEKEKALKTLSGEGCDSLVGQKIVINKKDDDGVLVEIYSDKDISPNQQSESRRLKKCAMCGAPLSDNPYRSKCESCNADIDQETVRRVVRSEYIHRQKETAKVETKTRDAENNVRKLVTKEKKISGGIGIKATGNYKTINISGGVNISLNGAVVLDGVSVSGGVNITGTIYVPHSFEDVEQSGGSNVNIEVIKLSWDQILEKVEPKS